MSKKLAAAIPSSATPATYHKPNAVIIGAVGGAIVAIIGATVYVFKRNSSKK